MKEIVARLRALPGVDGVAVVSRDGLPVLADLPSSFDREVFSAMIAAMTGAAETAAIESGRGLPDRILLDNSLGSITATGLDDQFLLVIVATPMLDAQALAGAVATLRREFQTIAR